MRIHAREENCRRAEQNVREALSKAIDEEKLTEAEILRLCAGVFGDTVGNIAKFSIRYERHGDANKPGGLE